MNKEQEIKKMHDLLIKIIGSELTEIPLEPADIERINVCDISKLYSLGKRYRLTHIIANCFYKNKENLDISPEYLSKFNQDAIISVYSNEQMQYAYEQICKILDDVCVPYIPLKGAVIRKLYPNESMRQSCDIDILIREDDIRIAIDALVKNGFNLKSKNYHDVSLFSPNNVHLELHFSIKENIKRLDAVLETAWEYASSIEGTRFGFSREFFMFYTYSHLTYHFLSGGCGIHPLMDIWIIKHKMRITYNDAEELLKKAGIYQFAKEVANLVDIIFSNAEKNDFSDIMLDYIFTGGLYGQQKNRVAIDKSRTNNNTAIYLIKRIFAPYQIMSAHFQILKKVPLLMPIFWIVRIIRAVFCGKMIDAFSEYKTVANFTDEQLREVKKLCKHLGL